MNTAVEVVEGRVNEAREGRCNAHKPDGTYCWNWPVRGRNRCRFHGGLSVRGADSPNFKTGRYSKVMPGNLERHYRDAVSDPDLMSCRAEIELLVTRISERVASLETGGSESIWADLQRSLEALRTAVEAIQDVADRAAIQASLDVVCGIVGAGQRTEETWDQLVNLVSECTKAKRRESQRIAQLRAAVPVDQVMALVVAIGNSVKRHVNDAAVESRIGCDIRDYLGALDTGR